jgi:hypothetical protein
VDEKRMLCVFAPLSIHPRWETWVAGRPIHACDLTQLPVWKKMLMWKSYGQYYRANPRSLAAMSEIARDYLSKNAAGVRADALVLGYAEGLAALTEAPWIRRRLSEFPSEAYDAALLCYPDAIGSGWRSIEKRIARMNIPSVQVLNGRRRVFPLNSVFRRRLYLRRFLAGSWIGEILFLAGLAVCGSLLMVWDAMLKPFRGRHG